MLGKNARRLIAIFRDVVHSDDHDPMQYLKRYASQIQITGKLFGYLDLAEPDEGSHLGWRPTRLLLEIMNERKIAMWSDKPIYREDQLIIELLCDAVFGDVRDTYPAGSFSLAFGVLHELGLMQLTREGDVGANRHLRRLFADAYYKRSISITQHALSETVSAREDLRRETASALEALWEAEWEETLKKRYRAKQRLSAKPQSSRITRL